MTFEPNGEGGYTFTVEVSPAAHLGWGSAEQGAPDLRLTVVVPGTGTGEHSADITDEVDGGIRFVWTFEAIEEGEESWPAQLNASTCSRDACPRSSTPILIILIVVAAGVVTAAVVVFVTISRKRGGGDVTSWRA